MWVIKSSTGSYLHSFSYGMYGAISASDWDDRQLFAYRFDHRDEALTLARKLTTDDAEATIVRLRPRKVRASGDSGGGT